jgi:capsule polysaccharide export protein KpsC/LpsZ
VPADVALTIRSPQYLDQLSVIDYLARIVPHTHDVLIKEHPALIGAMDRRRMVRMLGTRDNVHLVDPRVNNYEIMRRAEAIVTINSKSGAEGLLIGRPVLALGDAFYSTCDLVRRVSSLDALASSLRGVLRESEGEVLEQASIRRYFQDVWDASWPGELHVSGEENAAALAASLLRFLHRGMQTHSHLN